MSEYRYPVELVIEAGSQEEADEILSAVRESREVYSIAFTAPVEHRRRLTYTLSFDIGS